MFFWNSLLFPHLSLLLTSILLSSCNEELNCSCYSLLIDYTKAFDCVDHKKLWKILKEMGIPDHLICLLRNLYAGRKQQLELDMEQQTGSK